MNGVRKPPGLRPEQLAAIEALEQQGYTVRCVQPAPESWWVARRGEGRFVVGYAERTPIKLLRLANGAFAQPPQAYQQQVHEASKSEEVNSATA